MIHNDIISLNPNDITRQQAKGIIQYTLMLDYKCPYINPSTPDAINKLIESAKLCCNPLLSQMGYNHYNFFGTNTNTNNQTLTYLTHAPVLECPGFIPPSTSISDLLIQNSLMMAYHTILTELLSETTVTAYELANHLKGKGAHKANRQLKKNTSTNACSKASTFTRKYITRLSEYSNYFAFTIKPTQTESRLQFKSQYTALSNIICQTNISNFKKLFTSSTTASKSKLNEDVIADNTISVLDNLIKIFTPHLASGSSPKGDVIDILYEHYIAEKFLSLNLFHDILHLIAKVETITNHRYSLNNKETLQLLAKCQKLPCPFIRKYLLHFAFDHIYTDGTFSYLDYWKDHDLNRRNIVASTVNYPRGFQFDRWLKQYELFIDYLSDYIIPIYDWCFICMLMDSVEKEYPNQTHEENLKCALRTLEEYLQANYKKILHPLELPKQKGYPRQSYVINELQKTFYTDPNIALNITPLTLDLFTNPQQTFSNANKYTSEEKSQKIQILHNFFIESLFNPFQR